MIFAAPSAHSPLVFSLQFLRAQTVIPKYCERSSVKEPNHQAQSHAAHSRARSTARRRQRPRRRCASVVAPPPPPPPPPPRAARCEPSPATASDSATRAIPEPPTAPRVESLEPSARPCSIRSAACHHL
ncbi:hypothetical protein PVAP13_9NG310173 [Panicum virgatum]|uniref:Uncharacterized protein n=1 Tax=Panicum virgatum TaxID=38727 RepID=A0A8T0MN89_PANVG|nr:hypothetical protein PVAP13_9NG310173 [Panicum virgatum]